MSSETGIRSGAGGNYYHTLVLYDVLGIPCEYDIESLDLPVYVL
jgi:hypothetical protein